MWGKSRRDMGEKKRGGKRVRREGRVEYGKDRYKVRYVDHQHNNSIFFNTYLIGTARTWENVFGYYPHQPFMEFLHKKKRVCEERLIISHEKSTRRDPQ